MCFILHVSHGTSQPSGLLSTVWMWLPTPVSSLRIMVFSHICASQAAESLPLKLCSLAKTQELPQFQNEWPVLSLPCVQGWPGRCQSCAMECAAKQCLSPASPLQWKNVKVSSKVWCSLLKRNMLDWETELNPVLPLVELFCVVKRVLLFCTLQSLA